MKTTQAKFQIGKNGLTETFLETIRTAFKTRRQVRISVLKTASRNKEEIHKMAEKIQQSLKFKTNIRVLGFTIILIKSR